jgi:hypothetical protein
MHTTQDFLDVAFRGAPYTLHRDVWDVNSAEAKANALPIAQRDTNGRQFIVMNPIKEGHTYSPKSEGREHEVGTLENVHAYQNWVIEVDHLEPLQPGDAGWWEAIDSAIAPVLPIASAVVHSGGKSKHCWVCSADAVDYVTWRNVGEALKKLVPQCDGGVAGNPRKLVRLPGGTRDNGKEQTILDLKPALPFAHIKAYLLEKGVWNENAYKGRAVGSWGRKENEDWERIHPVEVAVKAWLKNSMGWEVERCNAQHRGGDNPTSLHDRGDHAFDYGDHLPWNWIDLASLLSKKIRFLDESSRFF